MLLRKTNDQRRSWRVFLGQPDPPQLLADDELVYDEPGRCGGVDSHCHHFCLIKRHGRYSLLVRNGSGDKRIGVGRQWIEALAALDSNGRYWIFQTFYHSLDDAVVCARNSEKGKWAMAAANKRIKTRKHPRGSVKVWIVSEAIIPNTRNYTLC